MIRTAIFVLGAALAAASLAACSEQTQEAAEAAASSAAEDAEAAINEATKEGAAALSDVAREGADAVGDAAATIEQTAKDEPTASPAAPST
jgi:hypothetical protein